MSKVKLLILSLLAPLTMLVMAQPAAAFNLFPKDTVCSGEAKNSPTCQQAGSEGGDKTNRVTGPNGIIAVAADVVALITGVAAVIMIIISGFTMVTSAGNAESVTTSRRRLIAAIIGLLIVVFAWTIIRFVTDNLIK